MAFVLKFKFPKKFKLKKWKFSQPVQICFNLKYNNLKNKNKKFPFIQPQTAHFAHSDCELIINEWNFHNFLSSMDCAEHKITEYEDFFGYTVMNLIWMRKSDVGKI